MNLPAAEPELFFVACPDTPAAPDAPAADRGTHDIACWQWGDAAAPQVVVCVHGLTRTGRDFDVLARALVERAGGALRVVCPDMPGRGRSDWLRDPTHYQVPYYAADMVALLAALQRRAPIERLSWIGTSMGGLIGIVVTGQPALPLPRPIDRLLLNDVGPALAWPALVRIAEYVGQPLHFDSLEQAADALWATSPTFGPHSKDEWLALSTPMFKPAPGGGWQLHYDPAIALPFKGITQEATAQGETGLWQLYDRIGARTLLTRGAQSDLLSLDVAREMTRRGPKARLVEFDGVGHAPMFVVPDQVEVAASFVLD